MKSLLSDISNNWNIFKIKLEQLVYMRWFGLLKKIQLDFIQYVDWVKDLRDEPVLDVDL